MQTVFISKIIKVGSSYGIVLPINIMGAYKWQRGDHVIFGFSDDKALWIKKLSDEELLNLKPQIIPSI